VIAAALIALRMRSRRHPSNRCLPRSKGRRKRLAGRLTRPSSSTGAKLLSPETSVYTTHYSSVELGKDDSVITSRSIPDRPRQFRLVALASLAQMYKAPDVLIRAVHRCVAAGLDLMLHIAGDGKYRPEI
jgi:hypothetical protein